MIRPPRVEDFAAIAAITNHYIATTTYHFAYKHGMWCDVEFFQKRLTTSSSSPPAVT